MAGRVIKKWKKQKNMVVTQRKCDTDICLGGSEKATKISIRTASLHASFVMVVISNFGIRLLILNINHASINYAHISSTVGNIFFL